MYRLSNLRVNDTLNGMLRACHISEHWSCNRLWIWSLIICHRLHLPPLVVLFTCPQIPLATSREIPRFISEYLIFLYGVYSREVELLLGTDVFIRDRSLEMLSYGKSATEFAIITLALYRSFFILILITLPAGRFLSATILAFTASP